MSLSKFQKIGKDKKAWCAAVHGIAKSRTRLRDWTTINKHSSGNTRKGTVTKGGNLVNLNSRKMWKERSFCGNKDDVLFLLPYVLLTFWGKTLCREHLKKSSKNSLNTGNIWFYKTTAHRQRFHFQRKPRSTSIPRHTSE